MLKHKMWTKECILEEALKYSGRKAFRLGSSGAYAAAKRIGIFELACKHMLSQSKSLTIEEIKQSAQNCESRVEFQRRYKSYYDAARARGILDEVCSHMQRLGNKYYRYVYAIQLDKQIYIGLTFNPKERLSSHRSGGTWAVKGILAAGATMTLLSDLLPLEEASILEQTKIDEYKNLGYEVLNKKVGGGIGGSTLIWTKDNILQEALKYSTREAFRTNGNGAHNAALKTGILDLACTHMRRQNRLPWTENEIVAEVSKYKTLKEFRTIGKNAYQALINRNMTWLLDSLERETIVWTYEMMAKEALKYLTRADFKRGSYNAYRVAMEHRLLDDICKHMSSGLKRKRNRRKRSMSHAA